jgi:hypothetical protein
MRRTLIAAAAATLIALAGGVGAASASTTRITFNASVKPSKAGTPRHPVGEAVSVLIDDASLIGIQPPVTNEIDIYVPKELRDRGSAFPSCDAALLGTKGVAACPPGSQIGSGSATGATLGIIEALEITIFNGPAGKSIILFVVGHNPASLNVPVIGSLIAPANVPNPGDFSSELTFPVPAALTRPLPGADGSLTHIAVRIAAARKVGRKTVNYFESVGAISSLAMTIS